MICKYCKEEGKTSYIYISGKATSITTWNGFNEYYDEQGNYHNHEANVLHYICSNGHIWDEVTKNIWPCGCNKND